MKTKEKQGFAWFSLVLGAASEELLQRSCFRGAASEELLQRSCLAGARSPSGAGNTTGQTGHSGKFGRQSQNKVPRRPPGGPEKYRFKSRKRQHEVQKKTTEGTEKDRPKSRKRQVKSRKRPTQVQVFTLSI